ncbi:Poly (ADP-ribose) glycohydrolase [Gossypium arboreum]|uniref:Poly (ADP-ribose) glycohydrolase n=1 Tax=Gossypium arboreum TaxID=29729 RepID=A0A0B0NMI9_GOSAR|nr:Poly (ADP-ribose) glycohydrolase [Gossypium arboreum]
MLLPFDEFDVLLGMDWLTQHDAAVNCKQKGEIGTRARDFECDSPKLTLVGKWFRDR